VYVPGGGQGEREIDQEATEGEQQWGDAKESGDADGELGDCYSDAGGHGHLAQPTQDASDWAALGEGLELRADEIARAGVQEVGV
jgi:hypothetical protein